jgi:hypothetical protein
MNYLHNIILRQLRNAEYIEFQRSTLEIVNTQAIVKAAVLTQYNAGSAALAKLNDAFINDPASPITAEITALDASRDKMVTGLVVLTDGFTYSPNADQAAAAEKLARNLKIYGKNIARQGLNAETTTIDNIINDWTNQTPLADAVTTLGLTDWLTALTTVNTQFRTKYAARTTAIAIEDQERPLSVTELREAATATLIDLFKKLDGYYAIHGDATPWGVVAAQVNALIDQYNATIAIRKGRVHAEEPAAVA